MLHDQGGYEELARVPLLVKPAGAAAAGRRVDGLAAMVDVLPTLLDMLDLESPASAQGRSLLPAIAAGHSRRPAVHMYSVLRNERFKYFSDERKLFDLAADPRETANLYFEQPARAAEFERNVRSLIAVDHAAAASFARVSSPGPGATLSEEELARLRSLGYLK
jgi:arylsulfatase A-like enzyme